MSSGGVPASSPPSAPLSAGSEKAFDFEFTMAFQPIVDLASLRVFGHEALARGLNNESASYVLDKVTEENRHGFDQACRVKAIEMAAQLNMDCMLSINFNPNAVTRSETCIRSTLEAATRCRFPVERIIFEVTESEKAEDLPRLRAILDDYKSRGFHTAIDDFGAGYSGLNLLAELPTDFVKVDMSLIKGIHRDRTRQAIVRGILQVCHDLSVTPIAEGIEAEEELGVMRDFGVELFQGYYFAKPSFRSLAEVSFEHA